VFETGRSARIDDYGDASGPFAVAACERGVLSSVAAPIVVEASLWGVIVAGCFEEQPLPADTGARLASFTELVATAVANAESRASLAQLAKEQEALRRVATLVARGVPPEHVFASVTEEVVMKLALRALSDGDAGASEMVAEALRQAEQANAELRKLAHGILPAALTRGGLRAGIEALVSRLSLPVEVDVPIERLSASVEATAYFVVSEALTNVVKHAHAASASVTARVESGELRVEVRDDGVGGARGGRGTGLGGLEDRVSALDGRLVVESHPGQGTRMSAVLPLASPGLNAG
jgi:signal transduction histidine kinase